MKPQLWRRPLHLCAPCAKSGSDNGAKRGGARQPNERSPDESSSSCRPPCSSETTPSARRHASASWPCRSWTSLTTL